MSSSRHLWRSLSVVIVFVASISELSFAQDGLEVDLLRLIRPEAHARSGNWSRPGDLGPLTVDGDKAMCVVPFEVAGPYTVSFEFTRRESDELVGLVLPLEKTQVLLEFSAWQSLAHGLSRINKASVKSEDNPTAVRPGTLENGRRYRVEVDVTPDGDAVAIKVRLDGDSLVDWKGNYADIEPNIGYNIPNNKRLVLVTNQSVVTFHSVGIRHLPGQGQPIELDFSRMAAASAPSPAAGIPTIPEGTAPSVPEGGGAVDLTKLVWKDVSGQLDVVDEAGEKVVRLRGQDSSVAILPGSLMGDGEIQVEISSDIFSGIAVRAQGVDNYDLLYFRPQNSGTARHENTVQYVCKGKDGADWRSLRTNFPGKYEAGAEMKMNEWFPVRLVLKGDTLNVYVNDSETPQLTVDPLLSDAASGQIGIWGWNTRFRNFSFTPAD